MYLCINNKRHFDSPASSGGETNKLKKLNIYTATDNRLSSKGQPFVCVSKTTDSEFIKKKNFFFLLESYFLNSRRSKRMWEMHH